MGSHHKRYGQHCIRWKAQENKKVKSTVVLVHGALSDASVWSGVARTLRSEGYTTIAPALALRSLNEDAEYLSAFLDTLDGSFVLVGFC